MVESSNDRQYRRINCYCFAIWIWIIKKRICYKLFNTI